jgi:FkbM family methyltransferase
MKPIKSSGTNKERTSEYLAKFDREIVLKNLVKNDTPVIFDVGANHGQSLEEFKKWWSNSIIHCFEPQEECWEELEELANRYSVEGKTFVNKFAVGSKAQKEQKFYSHNIHTGLSGFNKINLKSSDSVHLDKIKKKSNSATDMDDYSNDVNHERLIETISLDDYMSNLKIGHIDILKIDTQGYEPEVLSGIGKKLTNVDVVITELMFYDYYERSLSFSDIETYLLPAGFQLFDISHIAKNPLNGRTDWVDVIYVNKNIFK